MTTPVITGLYVPGNRPDRFDKAVATGAQLVILDLEDSVPLNEKADARSAVVDWLGRRPGTAGTHLQVRVNAGRGSDAAADLDAIRPWADAFTVRVPKVEAASDLEGLDDFPGVVALIESALGVERAFEIATHPLVGGLALGDSDLASDVGSAARPVIDYARVRLVFASRAAGLPAPMLSAWPGIRDLEGLRGDTARGKDLGLVGRVAIHPTQLDVIAQCFRPTPEELAWATGVESAASVGGVTTLSSGDMVDAAMVGRAARILDLHRANPLPQG